MTETTNFLARSRSRRTEEESGAADTTAPLAHIDDVEPLKTTTGGAEDGSKQVVTPWDVKGAVVEGVQVRE